MRELAAIRRDAARLTSPTRGERDESALLVNRALALLEVLRGQAAELHARCTALERSAAERDRHLRKLLESIPLPVVATDRTGVIVDANARAAAFFSRSIGRLRSELLLHYAEDRAAFTDVTRRLPSLTEPLETRVRIRPRERATFETAVTIAPDERDDSGHFLWFFSKS